jgi:hypothetical protein
MFYCIYWDVPLGRDSTEKYFLGKLQMPKMQKAIETPYRGCLTKFEITAVTAEEIGDLRYFPLIGLCGFSAFVNPLPISRVLSGRWNKGEGEVMTKC